MNKTKRNIIFFSAAIVVLAAGTFLLTRVDTDVEDAIESKDENYTVYSQPAEDIAYVSVDNGGEVIKSVNIGESEWTIDGLESDDVDPSKAYSLAGTVSTIISKNKYESPEDLSEYGLDDPMLTVTIVKKNGKSDVLYIGDMSPALGEYFVKPEGDDNVYTMYSYKVEALLKPLSYYQEFDRFSVIIEDITDIRIERSDGVVEIKIKDDIDQNTNNVWEMISPYEGSANDDYIDNKILAAIETISLSEPAAEDGGFTDSSTVLKLEVTPFDNETGKYGEKYSEMMTIGKTEGNITYVKYKDDVYTTPSSSVAFVNDSAFNIVSKLHALVDISKVKSVTVEYGDEAHELSVKKEDNNKYSFKLDGKKTDTEASQEMYRNIIALAVDNIYEGGETGETLLTITFDGIKKDDDAVIEIKTVDDLNCAMFRNGEAAFTIKKSKVTEFISLFEAYVSSINE